MGPITFSVSTIQFVDQTYAAVDSSITYGPVGTGDEIHMYPFSYPQDMTVSIPFQVSPENAEAMWKEFREQEYLRKLAQILLNRYINNQIYKVPKIKLRNFKKLCTTCIKTKWYNWMVRALKQL